MKKSLSFTVAVIAGTVAFGSSAAAQSLPYEHCTWTKASGETVCRTIIPPGYDIDGYQLRAAVEAEERSTVYNDFDINDNPYLFADLAGALPA